jgi:glycosyltransferase involved in cell wall biosynthesis
MKVAYIFDDKNQSTGAHHINKLIVEKLQDQGVEVSNYYPTVRKTMEMVRFKGLKSILFFYSLIEQKKAILQADLIQGTTFTPLSFLGFGIPVVCHFGSTNAGLLKATPQTHALEDEKKAIYKKLLADGVLAEISLKSRRPLRDIAEVELYTALLADAVIATSIGVKKELVSYGVPPERIRVIHNAIEDYWFEKPRRSLAPLSLVFLGRLSNDVFTWKLKGLDRLIVIYKKFPKLSKLTVAASSNARLAEWLIQEIPNHTAHFNLPKESIKKLLHGYKGSIVLLTSRYEGFSLSLIEAMSQGLIPIAYSVGVVPEIIEDGVNGFIVSSVTEAQAKIRMIAKNEYLRETLAKGAMKTAQRFHGEPMAAELADFYISITTKQGESAILTAATEAAAAQATIDIEWAANTAEKIVAKKKG